MSKPNIIQPSQASLATIPASLAEYLSFDNDLFERKPLTLGLHTKDIESLLGIISNYPNPDSHLIQRVKDYLEQVGYAHDYKGVIDPSDYTPAKWGKDPKHWYAIGKSDQAFLHPKHYREWLDSAIDVTIILLNYQSFYHVSQVREFLGYPCNSLGWVAWAVNPETGITDPTIATHFKPDTGYINDKGKLVKYLFPKPDKTGKRIDVICHNNGNPEYWSNLAKSDDTLYITEGSKKACSGLSHGLPTIAAPGTWMATDKVKYYSDDDNKRLTQHIVKPTLDWLLQTPKPVTIAYDSDLSVKLSVALSIETLGKAIKTYTDDVGVAVWDYDPVTKGMDDFIKHKGIDEFRAVLEKCLTLDAFIADRANSERKQLVTAIGSYTDEPDPFKQFLLKRDIVKHYPELKNFKEWDSLVSAVNNEGIVSDNKPKVVSLRELLQRGLPNLDWLLPGYFTRSSISCIYGKAGTGKSYLGYNLMLGLASGGKFLDVKVTQPLQVLLIVMDESEGSRGEKFENLAVCAYDDETLDRIGVWERNIQWKCNLKGIKELDEYLASNPTDMVIIDNLKHTLPDDVDILSTDVEKKVFIRLQNIAVKYNNHILMLHHTKKEGGNKEFYGSSAIADSLSYLGCLYGDFDDVLTLEDIKQRDTAKRKVSFTVDTDNNYAFVVTNSSEDVKPKPKPKLTNHDKVINALRSIADYVHKGRHDGNFTVKTIAELTGVSKSSVEDSFRKLANEGVIVKGDKRNSPYTMTSLFNEKY